MPSFEGDALGGVGLRAGPEQPLVLVFELLLLHDLLAGLQSRLLLHLVQLFLEL